MMLNIKRAFALTALFTTLIVGQFGNSPLPDIPPAPQSCGNIWCPD